MDGKEMDGTHFQGIEYDIQLDSVLTANRVVDFAGVCEGYEKSDRDGH